MTGVFTSIISTSAKVLSICALYLESVLLSSTLLKIRVWHLHLTKHVTNLAQSLQESSGKCIEQICTSGPNQNEMKKKTTWMVRVLENCKYNSRQRSVPSIINSSEVISFLSDKAKLFSINFASHSILNDKSHLLFDFLHFMEHKFCDIPCSSQEVSRFIKSFVTL